MLLFLLPAIVVFGALTGWALMEPLEGPGVAPWPVTVCWLLVLPMCGVWAGSALARTLRNPRVLDARRPMPLTALALGTLVALASAAACGLTLISYDTWFGYVLSRHTEHNLLVQLLTLSVWPLTAALIALLPWPPRHSPVNRCTGCGYSLARLTERARGRCPECGSEIGVARSAQTAD